MSIQCGICRNIMPSASFLNHKERKHSVIDHVPYAKLSDDQSRKGDSNGDSAAAAVAGPLVKCRFCPNRIPKSAMERHLQRCHIECHLCEKMLLKSNLAKHMEQKHRTSDSNGIGSSSNLPDLTVLSQSKLSMQSDSDGSITASNGNLATEFNSTTAQMPYQSDALSSSSLSLSSASATPSPPLSIPAIKPSNHQHQHQSPVDESNVIHVDIWQLCRYIRQGRVYNNNGCMYLRNSSNPM